MTNIKRSKPNLRFTYYTRNFKIDYIQFRAYKFGPCFMNVKNYDLFRFCLSHRNNDKFNNLISSRNSTTRCPSGRKTYFPNRCRPYLTKISHCRRTRTS